MFQTVFCAAIIIIVSLSQMVHIHTTCFGFHRAIIRCVFYEDGLKHFIVFICEIPESSRMLKHNITLTFTVRISDTN
jgi:hypothetical protein